MNYNYIFVFSYDLLHDYLVQNNCTCDETFEICEKVYKNFKNSEYNDVNTSEYACLQEFINDNPISYCISE